MNATLETVLIIHNFKCVTISFSEEIRLPASQIICQRGTVAVGYQVTARCMPHENVP